MKQMLLFLKILVTVGILSWLIIFVGLDKVWTTIKTVEIEWLLVVMLLIVVELFIGAYNLFMLIRYGLGEDVSLSKLFDLYSISWGISLLTPSKVSDIGLAYFLKREGISLGKGAAVLLVDNVITFFILIIMSLGGIWYLAGLKNLIFLLVGFIALFGISVYLFSYLRYLVKRILGRFALKFIGFYLALNTLAKKRTSVLLLNGILTIGKWFLMLLNFYIVFYALGYAIPYFTILLVAPLARLISMIPITINGIGIRETVGVFLFSQFGAEKNIVLSSYLILMILNYVVATMIVVSLSVVRRKKQSMKE